MSETVYLEKQSDIDETYRKQVLSAENKDFDSIRPRVEEHLPLIVQHIQDIIDLCNELDAIKRTLFYGSTQEDLEKKGVSLPEWKGEVLLPYESTARAGNSQTIRFLHAVIGKCTEVGELFEPLLAYLEDGTPVDLVNISEELGDDAFYTEQLKDTFCLLTHNILNGNIRKLVGGENARYKGGQFSEEQALSRDTDAERKHLEE